MSDDDRGQFAPVVPASKLRKARRKELAMIKPSEKTRSDIALEHGTVGIDRIKTLPVHEELDDDVVNAIAESFPLLGEGLSQDDANEFLETSVESTQQTLPPGSPFPSGEACDSIEPPERIYSIESVPLTELGLPAGRAQCDPHRIAVVAKSDVPLQPIPAVRTAYGAVVVGADYRVLVATERAMTHVDCIFTTVDRNVARMADIEHSLYSAYLSPLEKAALIAEWLECWRRVSGQNVQKDQVKLGRPCSGIAQAARVLPVPGKTEDARRKSIERVMRIQSLPAEAKEAAIKVGLHRNQSALLAIAKEESTADQLRKVTELAEKRLSRRRRKSGPASSASVDALAPSIAPQQDFELSWEGWPGAADHSATEIALVEHGLDPAQRLMLEDLVSVFKNAVLPKVISAPDVVRERFVDVLAHVINSLNANSANSAT
jgi:hypothetical protein